MTTNDRLMVFDEDERHEAPVPPAPMPDPAPPAPAADPARQLQIPLTPDEWSQLSPADRLKVEAAMAARAKQQENAQRMGEQANEPRPAAPATSSATSGGDPTDESLVYGGQETVRVETVIYRAFVELDDGLARAIPAGVQLAPSSMNAVVRRIQRRALLADAREDARDQHALADADALRVPTGRLEVIQQDPPRALPAPADVAVIQEAIREADPVVSQPRSVVSLDDLQRQPDRFVAVGPDDPRVQRLLAARRADAAPAEMAPAGSAVADAARQRWTLVGCFNALLIYGAIFLFIVFLLSHIPFTAAYVARGGAWLKAHTIDLALTRFGLGMPKVVPVKEGDADEFTFKRAPSITCGQFAAAMAGMPVAAESVSACERIARAGYEPAILAAMAKMAMQNTSPESQKQWQPAPLGNYNLFSMSSTNGKSSVYGSYTEAFGAFVGALDTTYADQSITNLASFIPLVCPKETCDAAVFLKNVQEAVRAVRAIPDPAGATTSGATPAPDHAPAPGESSLATQESGPLRVTITAITVEDDGHGGKQTRVQGSIANISSDKTIEVPVSAFSFSADSDKGGTLYAPNGDEKVTLAPGQSTAINLTVPVPDDKALRLSLVVSPDVDVQLDLRK